MGFEGSERIVCRFLATLRVRRPSQLTVRFETPGSIRSFVFRAGLFFSFGSDFAKAR